MPPKSKKKESSSNPSKSRNEPAKDAPPVTLPNWPPFKPLIPESDLNFQEVLQDQIVTIPNFWTATLCKNYVSFLSSLPLATTPGKPKKGDAVRVNDRFQVTDAAFAERLWSETGLKNLVLGLNENNSLVNSKDDISKVWGGDVVCSLFDHISRFGSKRVALRSG